MAQGIGNNSTQYGMLVYLSNTYSSGTSISIRDTSDNEIISYTSVKSFSSIVFSSNMGMNTRADHRDGPRR